MMLGKDSLSTSDWIFGTVLSSMMTIPFMLIMKGMSDSLRELADQKSRQ